MVNKLWVSLSKPPPPQSHPRKKSLKCRRKKFSVFIRKKEYEKSCSRWFRCVLKNKEEFHLQWDEKESVRVWVQLKSEEGDGEGNWERFFSCPTEQKKFSAVCAVGEHRTQKPEELNCVYKSDNCWETKSFTVEFLTLYFFSPFFCCSFVENESRFSVFLAQISSRKHLSDESFFSPVTRRSEQRRIERIYQMEGERKTLQLFMSGF